MGDPAGISLTCPLCSKRFRVHGGSAGRQFICPTEGCGNVLTVPRPAAAPQPHPTASIFELDDDEPLPLSQARPRPQPPAQPRPQPQPQPRRRPVRHEPDSDDEPLPPRRRSSGRWLGVGLLVLLLLAVAGGVGYWLMNRPTADSVEEPGPTAPPTPNGPRVVLLEKLPDTIRIRQFYLTGEFALTGEFVPGAGRAPPTDQWEQTLPTGTEEVGIGMAFEFDPPDGTRFDVELTSAGGAVALREYRTMLTFRGQHGTNIVLVLNPKDGEFLDGWYKAKVKVNGTPAAELNFAVGAKLPTVSAETLRGTTWRRRDGGGTRFEFGADGTFIVTEPDFGGGGGPGGGGDRRRTGRWQAKGDTFTAYLSAAGPDRGQVEFRGVCLKNELRVRKREEFRDTNKGELRFGEWRVYGVLRNQAELPIEGDKTRELTPKDDGPIPAPPIGPGPEPTPGPKFEPPPDRPRGKG